jgi:hypothetical protein
MRVMMDYLLAAVLFVFIVTVLVVLWKREHPGRSPSLGVPTAPEG